MDLHIHTTCSDGSMTPKEVIDEAFNNGVSVISIADHDTIDAYNEELFQYAESKNILVIPGVEISTKTRKCGFHVLGYNFDIFHKYSTVRLEFEYLFRSPMPENAYITSVQTMQSHSFLFGAYYDYYFWYVDYDDPDSIRSKINNGKRPLMSVYAGILIGGAINTYTVSESYEYGGIFKTSTYYNKGQFLYGFGLGLGFHITPLLSADIGYRLLFTEETQSNHDIIASLRFNF